MSSENKVREDKLTLDEAKLRQDKALYEQQLQVTQMNVIRLQGAIAYIDKTLTELNKPEEKPEPETQPS